MVIVKTVNDDILNAKECYIAQQCNCNTIKAHGLSKSISDKYPWANPYGIRRRKSNNSTTQPDTPGTIVQMQSPKLVDEHIVLCLMAQWLPGKPNAYKQYYPTTYDDTYKNRKSGFKNV